MIYFLYEFPVSKGTIGVTLIDWIKLVMQVQADKDEGSYNDEYNAQSMSLAAVIRNNPSLTHE